MNARIYSGVIFRPEIHGCIANKSTCTAAIEPKLEMQLGKGEGKVYHQIYLDLTKAYDTVNRERLLKILKAYGMGPNTIRLLNSVWEGSGIVPKCAGRYGQRIPTERGVRQGDITSPAFFNLILDAIIRVARAENALNNPELAHLLRTTFYVDDGRLGLTNAVLLQDNLDRYARLFVIMGLKMNTTKTVSMTTALTRTLLLETPG